MTAPKWSPEPSLGPWRVGHVSQLTHNGPAPTDLELLGRPAVLRLPFTDHARLERALNVLVRIGRAQQREAAISLCCNFARLTYLMRRAARVRRIVRAMVKP